MGLREWIRRNEREADTSWIGGPAAGPFGGTDGNGYAITQFTPDAVEVIRLGASTASLNNLYRTQWAVRTCVNFLALNIGQLNIKVRQRQTNDEAPLTLPNHELSQLLQRPNPQTDRFTMQRDTISDLAIYQDAYWLKVGQGRPRELYRLPPCYVTIEGGDVLNGPSAYIFTTKTGERRFRPDQIVHFHGYNPIDTRLGSPILEALRMVLNEEVEASRYRTKFWSKSTRQGGFIQRPPNATMDDQSRKRFIETLKTFTRGGTHEADWMLLEDGETPHPMAFSPKDSEFIEGREWALDTVATAFHIPLAVLSRKGTATFASAKEFRKMVYVDTFGPWNSMYEGAIGLQLVPDFNDDRLFVEMNIEEKLQGDFEQQADAARQSVQVPWQSVNEMRKLRGLPPTGDPAHDRPAKPTNYTFGDETPPEEQAELFQIGGNG